MTYEQEQKKLAERLNEADRDVKAKAINALGIFANGFLSGYEAAKAEAETQAQGA